MFLHPEQPSMTTPSMAQIASDFPLNPILNFPLWESPQVDRNSCANFPPFYDPGLWTMYSQAAVGGNIQEFPKSRKRVREEDLGLSAWINTKMNAGEQLFVDELNKNQPCCSLCSSFCGDNDFLIRMRKELEELDLFVLMQMEKIRLEVEQKGKNYWNNVFRVVDEGMERIIKCKDEEIVKISQRNTALEEKVKILLMEGKTWKTLAHSNDATIISLRCYLEFAKAKEGEGESKVEDSMSCCYDRKLNNSIVNSKNSNNRPNCRGCRRNEVSILILPCRHLCLCSECEHKFQSCPMCMSPKTACIKVLMS
ncbi:putative BOI-related E3 ubiquitin-protein ligase 3 [Tasmannia lanceolata]|uniref:putative BOI-related E3 ubiquitin-protein ligase 3 n=1 Tax=Tasmannia lanceolata TaxID=3420 RepID=UPI00406494FC